MVDEQVQRKLSAIMFTDIVGYSKMMGEDEAGTMAFLKFHNGILNEEIQKNDGRVIKTVGDAFLADFNSAVNAVRCAVSIQKRFHEHNAKTGDNRNVRIGIHIGDVVISNNDIFGDGVNIAARLQPIAEPGGICISQDVYNHIKNKVEFHVVSLGPRELKNISQKVEIYKIVTEVMGASGQPGNQSGKKFPFLPVVLALVVIAVLGGIWFLSSKINWGKWASNFSAPKPTPVPTRVSAPSPVPPAPTPAKMSKPVPAKSKKPKNKPSHPSKHKTPVQPSNSGPVQPPPLNDKSPSGPQQPPPQ